MKRSGKSATPGVYCHVSDLVDPDTGNIIRGLTPCTPYDERLPVWQRLSPGDKVRCDIRRPRTLGYHRYAHQLGILFTQNIPDFEYLDAHEAIKRLQHEAGVECDMVMIEAQTFWRRITGHVQKMFPGNKAIRSALHLIGFTLKGRQIRVYWPRSIAFDSMGEDAFRAFVSAICKYVSSTYWPACTPEQIEAMAGSMPDEGHS